MRQITSKFNIYLKSINIINNNFEKLVLNFIFGSFGVLALVYVFLLGNMVKNIIQRQSFETSLRTLSSEVQTLEATYLSMSNNVDLNLSYSLGFKEIKPTFATRKSLGLGSSSSFGSVKIAKNDL